MPSPYPGIYRAKALRLDGTNLAALIPQVFGEETVTITAFVGSPPAVSEMGWVAFHGGMPNNPVWLGAGTAGGGGTGTVTDTLWVGPDPPPELDIELWWDTDATIPLDPRYLPSVGGTMTGHITLPTSDPPEPYGAVHADYMHRWINLAVSTSKPKHFNATGTAVSGTFTTETSVCVLNVSAQPVSGIVYTWSHLRLDKTTAADAFLTRQRLTNASGSIGVESYLAGLTSGSMSWLSCSWTLAANTAATYVTSVFRNSGTGTAQTYATSYHNRMTALWIPD